ncbi:bifunctional hydroxymethylpyrimidine kinase/phosphomethylpyrimidine kinase [Enterococcus sp. LJL99]
MKKVLSIAGSDCSGGAGIQADLKTFAAHGVYGMSVITSVVAENTFRVISYQDIKPKIIQEQIDAVFEDLPPKAVKIGMLSNKQTITAVARSLKKWHPKHVVLDPVMYAKNGDALMEPVAIQTLIEKILPAASLITPNIPEAEKICQKEIVTLNDMEQASQLIYDLSGTTVLIKGGHKTGEATDVFFDGKKFYHYTSERINTKNTHGTGCTFSSAIASQLALGNTPEQAINKAKKYITMAIKHSLPIGSGHGPTNHFYSLYKNGLRKETSE